MVKSFISLAPGRHSPVERDPAEQRVRGGGRHEVSGHPARLQTQQWTRKEFPQNQVGWSDPVSQGEVALRVTRLGKFLTFGYFLLGYFLNFT
jgi:hypothetical protein